MFSYEDKLDELKLLHLNQKLFDQPDRETCALKCHYL